MENLNDEFFEIWEDEIAAYQEVELILKKQKSSLMKWDIKEFQQASQEAVKLISYAHKKTNHRHDIMESIFILKDIFTKEKSLKNIDEILDEKEEKERGRIFFKVFSNTLKQIDRLTVETKELIKTGLELVSENLEMISDVIDRDRVYSRVGMINNNKSSILLNKQI
ncbi:MAG: flagellar export chaperone FlgN [Candidatus Cloacimonadota bacterium]|nr:flagellar export chaperone FlgN [Candidatus Cloacimonadota bacterium]